MIVGLYATLGVFLLIASRDPYANKSLIWFTVWSSVVHGAIMGAQAFSDSGERGHLIGDVPALFLVAIVLAVLMPRTAQAWVRLANVCSWPKADMPQNAIDVAIRGKADIAFCNAYVSL